MLSSGLSSFLRSLPALLLATSCFSAPVFSSDSLTQELFRAAAESNVNQRYTVESISIGGVRYDEAKISSHLRRRIVALIGSRCDTAALEGLAADLRRELHLRAVNQHLLKGSEPDRVRVNFEIERKQVEVSVPRFLFHSRQGITGEVDASTRFGQNTVTLAAVSNGDNLVERFTGIAGRYEDNKVGTDKVRFGVAFEDYHEVWNQTTRDAVTPASGLSLYRARAGVSPEFTFALVRPLTLSLGVSYEFLDPENRAEPNRLAGALAGELRYGHRIEADAAQSVEAKYNFRAGTRSLGSDYSYSRHMVSFRYEIKSGRQTASDELAAGAVAGQAPMFERFVLGSDSTLRGWDRYAIDPVGGNRMVHNSLTYGYQLGERTAEIFYDSGALWNAGREARVRHSVGVSFRQGIFVLTTAFPVVEGHITPVFMAGMNY